MCMQFYVLRQMCSLNRVHGVIKHTCWKLRLGRLCLHLFPTAENQPHPLPTWAANSVPAVQHNSVCTHTGRLLLKKHKFIYLFFLPPQL